jgi:hypothetical protein
MIFDEMNKQSPQYFRWRWIMPSLVLAFRGLRRSYQQALQRFAKESHLMVFKGRTSYNIQDMNRVELGILYDLDIELE